MIGTSHYSAEVGCYAAGGDEPTLPECCPIEGYTLLEANLSMSSGCVFNPGPTDAEFFHSRSQRAGVDTK